AESLRNRPRDSQTACALLHPPRLASRGPISQELVLDVETRRLAVGGHEAFHLFHVSRECGAVEPVAIPFPQVGLARLPELFEMVLGLASPVRARIKVEVGLPGLLRFWSQPEAGE